MLTVCTAGIGGSTPVAIGGSVISDMFLPKDRAAAMAIYTMGPLLGPVVGPIAGGFIAETIGFKWVFIIIAILAAFASVLGITFLRETYEPVIRERLVRQCVPERERAEKFTEAARNGLTGREILWLNMTRPIALMCKSFILFVLSLFMAM
jgi:MFS family permease